MTPDDADDVLIDPQVHAALLIVEIGNSHTSIATFLEDRIYTNRRFELTELGAICDHVLEAWAALPEERIRAVVAGAVVPAVQERLIETISNRLDTPIHAVGLDLRLPIPIALEAPERVGIDRICAAAAAYDRIQRSCVVASFGTAITIDCVNDEGVFMGGSILPGLTLQARILNEGTAQLPLVEIADTSNTYGANTEDAIRLGIIHGAVGALREIVERYATELGSWPQLVVTGGNAELIRRHCEFIDNLVPDLCIRGIALAYRKHFTRFETET